MDACTGMMLGSTIAGIAFGYADVAAVHCMAEALGGLYDTPHGVANAIFLPAVCEYNIPADPKKYAEVANALGADTFGCSDEDAALRGVEKIRTLCADIGIPKMREIDRVDPADFRALAAASAANVSDSSNPREMTPKDYLYLFNKVYEE
jgi:alcohol dehydrogenase